MHSFIQEMVTSREITAMVYRMLLSLMPFIQQIQVSTMPKFGHPSESLYLNYVGISYPDGQYQDPLNTQDKIQGPIEHSVP